MTVEYLFKTRADVVNRETGKTGNIIDIKDNWAEVKYIDGSSDSTNVKDFFVYFDIRLTTDIDVIGLAARMGLPMDKFANRQRAVKECLGMPKDKAIVKLDNIMWGC